MSAPGDRQDYLTTQAALEQRGFEVATVIDIGAAEATYFLSRMQRDLFLRARHFFVDAMAENEPTYERLEAKFDVGHEIAALAAMEGEVELRVDPHYYNTHIDHLQPATSYEAKRRVRMTTLDSVVERHELRPPFAIKLDVQGAELDVLRGGLRCLEDSVIVTTEIQIFMQRDTLVELLAFMNGAGWALYDLTNLGYYPSDGTLYQCYATFIPKAMDFRAGTPWVLPEQEPDVMRQLRARRAANLSLIDGLLG